jgi:hypothetical protein
VQDTAFAIQLTAKTMSEVKLPLNTQTGDFNVSHMRFQKIPTNTDTEWLLSTCNIEPVLQWAFDILLSEYKVHKANEITAFYLNISVMPEAVSLQGNLFKRQVSNYLSDISTKCRFWICGLTGSNQTM